MIFILIVNLIFDVIFDVISGSHTEKPVTLLALAEN